MCVACSTYVCYEIIKIFLAVYFFITDMSIRGKNRQLRSISICCSQCIEIISEGDFFYHNVRRYVKVRYSQKNIGIISIAQKCAVFYPKLCILTLQSI